MYPAVAQLSVMERCLFRALFGDIADAREFLSFAFVFVDLPPENFGRLTMLVQVGVERLLDEFPDEFPDRRTFWPDAGRAELRLCLGFEDRFLYPHDNRGVDRLPDVG